MFSIVGKRLKRVLSVVLILVICFTVIIPSTVTEVEAATNITRINGSNRYETSYLAAKYLKKINGSRFSSVILATGSKYPDALGGSYLSKVTGAPIILVCNKYLTETIDCVSKVMKKNGTIYILGGKNSVSRTVEKSFKELGYTNIKRLHGIDRFETNLEILKEADTINKEKNSTVDKSLMICTGANYADALSAGATGHPIMVVKDRLSSEQLQYIKTRGFKRFYLVGGKNAVPNRIENKLQSYGTVSRISGSDRYDTSVRTAKKFFGKSNHKDVIVVSGNNFPDGLSAAPIAQALGCPILMVSDSHIAESYNYVKLRSVQKATIMGGKKLVPDILIGVSGTGFVKGWNTYNGNYVFINRDGSVATKAFKDHDTAIKPTSGGVVSSGQRYLFNGFIWPAEATITSYFGYRDDVPYWASSDHGGIDIGVWYYTPVKAAAPGTVIYPTGYYGGYGNLVVIKHTNGFVTYYGHNSYNLVSVGDKVQQGQVIAMSGSTGNSTGPHLHFEILLNGIRRDPLDYLPRNRYW